MRYAVHVQEGDAPPVFLQSSEFLERLKKDKASLDRWMTEMSFTPVNFTKVKFTIFADGEPIFTKNLIGLGSRSWLKVTS
jgi:hypothetical protein